MTDRHTDGWLQAIYTSADDLSGRHGGWGVKATSPGLSPHQLRILEREFKTVLEEVEPTPAFATADVLDARPRRLLYRRVDGAMCLWHAATAGHDATGRPGNVFNHAALHPGAAGPVRPIELWRSPDLLTPFGAIAVTEARLPAGLRPGTAVTRETVTAFIDGDDRIYALEWLLAAVAHAVEKGLRLVISVPTTDEAALWMGAISYATSAAHARRLGFVTFERRGGLERMEQNGFCVVFVPPGELDGETPGGMLVVDPARDLDDSDRERWTGPNGVDFPSRKIWQDCVLDVFADGAQTVPLLELVDEVAGALYDDEAGAVPLEWPLLTAVLSAGDTGGANRESRLLACLADAPASTVLTPHLQRLIDEAAADDALRETLLSGLAEKSPVWRELQERAVTRFLDGGWRSASEVPPGSAFDATIHRAAAADAIRDASDDLAGSEDDVVRAGRLIGFVHAHGHTPDPTGAPDTAIEAALDAVVARVTDESRGIPRERWTELGPGLSGRLGLGPSLRKPPASPSGATQPRHEEARDLVDTRTWTDTSAAFGPSPAGWGQPPTTPVPTSSPVPSGLLAAPATPPIPGPPPRTDSTTGASTRPPFDAVEAFGESRSTTVIERGASGSATGADHDVVDGLRELLSHCTPDDADRAKALGDALLVARGIRPVPLLRPSGGLRAASVQVEVIFRDLRGDAHEREAALRWLCCFHALGEARLLPDIGSVPRIAPDCAEALIANPEVGIDALGYLLVEARIRDAAALFAASAERSASAASSASLLGMDLGAQRLGWAAVRRAWQVLPQDRRLAFRQDFGPRSHQLVTQSFPGARDIAERVAGLDTLLTDTHRKA